MHLCVSKKCCINTSKSQISTLGFELAYHFPPDDRKGFGSISEMGFWIPAPGKVPTAYNAQPHSLLLLALSFPVSATHPAQHLQDQENVKQMSFLCPLPALLLPPEARGGPSFAVVHGGAHDSLILLFHQSTASDNCSVYTWADSCNNQHFWPDMQDTKYRTKGSFEEPAVVVEL